MAKIPEMEMAQPTHKSDLTGDPIPPPEYAVIRVTYGDTVYVTDAAWGEVSDWAANGTQNKKSGRRRANSKNGEGSTDASPPADTDGETAAKGKNK